MMLVPKAGCQKAGQRGLASPLGNERGMALILVLVMLLLLTILGVTVLTSTTADLRITGNYRNSGNAFYTAESAMEFAQSNSLIYSALGTASTWPLSGAGKILNDDGTPSGTPNSKYADYNEFRIYKDSAKTQLEGTAHIKVDFTGTGAVPSGLGTEVDAGLGGGTGFKANFFVVSVIAEGANDTQAEIESQVARIVPK